MLIPFARRAIALKIETTVGVDASPDPTVDGLLIFNGSSSIDTDTVDRPLDSAVFGADEFLTALPRGVIQGQIELLGASTLGVAAPIGQALRIGGFAETLVATTSATYNLVSEALETATVDFWHSGTFMKLLGARAQISGVGFTIGGRLVADIRIEGAAVNNKVTEDSLPTQDLSAFRSPPLANSANTTLTVNSFDVEGFSASFDLGTAIVTKEHTEAVVTQITGRSGTFSAGFYRPAISSLDVYALKNAHTQFPIAITVNGGATKITTVTAAKNQIDTIAHQDQEEDFGYQINGRLLRNGTAGELVIAFT